MLYSDIAPSYYEKLGFKLKKMKLTEVSARNNKMTIKEHSLEYEKLIPNYRFMIERRKDYRNWLFERSGARLFLDEKTALTP